MGGLIATKKEMMAIELNNVNVMNIYVCFQESIRARNSTRGLTNLHCRTFNR